MNCYEVYDRKNVYILSFKLSVARSRKYSASARFRSVRKALFFVLHLTHRFLIWQLRSHNPVFRALFIRRESSRDRFTVTGIQSFLPKK